MLVDKDDFCLVSGDVYHFNCFRLIGDRDRECIVNEDTDNNTVFETNKKRFLLRRPRNNLNIGYWRFKDPLAH